MANVQAFGEFAARETFVTGLTPSTLQKPMVIDDNLFFPITRIRREIVNDFK